MAGGGGDVERRLLGSDNAVLLVVLAGWDSGDVRLCLRPCSSDGEVGSDETGGV